MRRPLLRDALARASALLAFAVASPVLAQTISLPIDLERTTPLRDRAQKPYWVNYADCVNDDEVKFALTLSGAFSGQRLQVWAGTTDCTPLSARTGQVPTCWLVFESTMSDQRPTIAIRSRDIAAKNKVTDTPNGPGSGTLANCETGTDPPLTLGLYFMFVSNDALLGQAATWTQTGLDITRPAPPTNVTATAGETRIHLEWDIPTDTDVKGYRFYCDPPPGSATALAPASTDVEVGQVRQLAEAGVGGAPLWYDAGSGGTGGTSGGTGGAASSQPNCNDTSAVAAGNVADPAYQCGSVAGRNAAKGTASGLVNDVDYAVSVASYDEVGNIGLLSGNDCATPVNVTDFFEYYRMNGGKGGGGICGFAPPRRFALAPLSLVALALGVAALRRRRA